MPHQFTLFTQMPAGHLSLKSKRLRAERLDSDGVSVLQECTEGLASRISSMRLVGGPPSVLDWDHLRRRLGLMT